MQRKMQTFSERFLLYTWLSTNCGCPFLLQYSFVVGELRFVTFCGFWSSYTGSFGSYYELSHKMGGGKPSK